jgi:heat shock protein HslJ
MKRLSSYPAIVALITTALTGVPGAAIIANPLQGTSWKLKSWSVSSIDPASITITATFADGRVSGNSGVNSYSGPYKLGASHSFSAGPFVATQMGGPEPAMRAESIVLTLLGQAKSYNLTGSKLTLLDRSGNETLRFNRSGPRSTVR